MLKQKARSCVTTDVELQYLGYTVSSLQYVL